MRSTGVEHKRREFAEFYAAARDECLRAVLASVADRQLAEDLVAEAFARAWTRWRTVRHHPAPRAWVVRTALNTNVSWWRRRRRETPLLDSTEADRPALAGWDVTADLDLRSELLAELRRLPERQRAVLVLRVFFDLDVATTARLLGIAPGTVGAHQHRALATLRTRVPSLDDQRDDQEVGS